MNQLIDKAEASESQADASAQNDPASQTPAHPAWCSPRWCRADKKRGAIIHLGHPHYLTGDQVRDDHLKLQLWQSATLSAEEVAELGGPFVKLSITDHLGVVRYSKDLKLSQAEALRVLLAVVCPTEDVQFFNTLIEAYRMGAASGAEAGQRAIHYASEIATLHLGEFAEATAQTFSTVTE